MEWINKAARSVRGVTSCQAYVDFSHLHTLAQREVFWVTRAKDNMAYEIVGRRTPPSKSILLDAEIRLTVDKSRCEYPGLMRLIVAVVEVNGKETVLSCSLEPPRYVQRA